jgi:hypothetical protein
MGIILLLTVLAVISYVFARSAYALWLYHKRLQDKQSDFGGTYYAKHPRWYPYMKIAIPLVSIGFFFNAIVAFLAFCYIVVKFANSYL